MREFDLSREGLIEPLPEAQRFRGRVAVLIDEMSYSATILFATTMQDHRLARLLGRPTGGHANQTGNMMPTTLAHSGFTVFIATRDFVRPNGDVQPGPVVPDEIVREPAEPSPAAQPGAPDATVQRALAWLSAPA
jgi:C-terminal processing protease CtpA/Prc